MIVMRPVDELYFNWLCAKVSDNTSSSNYLWLLSFLYRYEFIAILPGDHNRIEDGLELRHRFYLETSLTQESWKQDGCSIFELLVGFSERAAWQTPDSSSFWFWRMIENLSLDGFRYSYDKTIEREIEDILYVFVWRLYDSNGYGGLFPIHSTDFDQRTIEIWYQFAEYLTEVEPI